MWHIKSWIVPHGNFVPKRNTVRWTCWEIHKPAILYSMMSNTPQSYPINCICTFFIWCREVRKSFIDSLCASNNINQFLKIEIYSIHNPMRKNSNKFLWNAWNDRPNPQLFTVQWYQARFDTECTRKNPIVECVRLVSNEIIPLTVWKMLISYRSDQRISFQKKTSHIDVVYGNLCPRLWSTDIVLWDTFIRAEHGMMIAWNTMTWQLFILIDGLWLLPYNRFWSVSNLSKICPLPYVS